MKFNIGDLVRIKNRGEGWDGVLCRIDKQSWDKGYLLTAIDLPPKTWRRYNTSMNIGPWGIGYLELATAEPDETEAFFV